MKSVASKQKTGINVALLLKVKAHILAEPARVKMGVWAEEYDSQFDGPKGPACNTVGCIAGWTVLHRYKQPLRRAKILSGSEINLLAAKMLGLDTTQAGTLFLPFYWPSEFKLRLAEQKAGTAAYARVVARRIDHFIKTDGAE